MPLDLKYDPSYWKEYYGGDYSRTYKYAFDFNMLLDRWHKKFKELPSSFADIGSGPGQTLLEAEKALGPEALIYGVEIQKLPKDILVSDKVIFGDFLDIYANLKPVDLEYVACSMYIDWGLQEQFIKACLSLAKKAVCFANVYLQDKHNIPSDPKRQVIYKDRESFIKCIEQEGWDYIDGPWEFFTKKGV